MKSDKNIVVFGCKSTTKFFCEFLLSIGRLNAIISIDKQLAEKNQVADYVEMRDFAQEHKIIFYSCKTYDLSSEEDRQFCEDLNIDIAFVIGWQRLIPEKILFKISIGAFGMHGSSLNLPKGRGRSPLNWSIIEGREVFYTNLFKYDEGIDSGAVVDTYKFNIHQHDNAETLHYKNLLAMKVLVNRNLEVILGNSFVADIQSDLVPTYYPKRNPDDSLIDWEQDVYQIERFIRAVSPPFNGAFTFIDHKKLVIENAHVFDSNEFGYEKALIPSVVEVFPSKKFLIKGFGGLLLVNAYHYEGVIKKGDRFHHNGMKPFNFKLNAQRGYDI